MEVEERGKIRINGVDMMREYKERWRKKGIEYMNEESFQKGGEKGMQIEEKEIEGEG